MAPVSSPMRIATQGSKWRSGVYGTLACCALLVSVPGCLQAQTRDGGPASSELATYRAALGLVSNGKPQSARLLLESGGSTSPLGSESALLLAYLQENAKDTAAARRTLSAVEQPTALSLSYLERLGGSTSAPIPTSNLANNKPAGETAADRPPSPNSPNPARLGATDARVTKLEKHMFAIVNQERQSNGRPALEYSENIAEVARAHSAEMRDKEFFAHESPTAALREPMDRYVAGIGTSPRIVAENVYRAWGGRSFLTEADVRAAHVALMNSPGHRANILMAGVTRVGIGMTTDSTGNIWITQVFAKP